MRTGHNKLTFDSDGIARLRVSPELHQWKARTMAGNGRDAVIEYGGRKML